MESSILTEYQQEELRLTFNKFRPNAEGKISIAHMKEIMINIEDTKVLEANNLPGLMNTQIDVDPEIIKLHSIKAIISASDMLEREELDFNDFLRIYEEIIIDPCENTYAHAFNMLDLNQDGTINLNDLQKFASLVGEDIKNDREAQEMFRMVSNSNKEYLTFEEFCNYCNSELKQ